MVKSSHFPFSNFSGLSSMDDQANNIRLSIFIIISACAGVTALIWLVIVLNHHKNKGINSAITTIIILLFTDILELLLSPYIVTKLLQGDSCWEESVICQIFTLFWVEMRVWGVYVQQMAMVESIYALRHPFCSSHGFLPCSIITLSITAFIVCLLSEFVVLLRFPTLFLLFAMTIASWIITCRTPTKNQNSYITKRSKPLVVAIARFTLTLYVVRFFMLYIFPLWTQMIAMCECLFSVRIILDPLMCLLICNEKFIHAAQTDTQHNNDQTSALAEH